MRVERVENLFDNRQGVEAMYKHILIPTDGSELSNMAIRHGVLSFETKCNTPADLIIGTADQDLRECCHAMLFAFVG